MTIFRTDNFVEAGDPFLKSGHTPDTGVAWVGNGTTVKIESSSSSTWQATAGVTSGLLGADNPSNADYFAEITCSLGGTATTDRVGVICRAEGSTTFEYNTHTYYLFRVAGGSPVAWTFWRCDDGVLTSSLGLSGTVSGTLPNVASTDEMKLKMTVTGANDTVTIKLEYDENISGGGFSGYSTLSTITDTNTTAGFERITAAGNPGFYGRDVNFRISYFNAETLSATKFGIDEQAQRATTGTQDFTDSALVNMSGRCGIFMSTRATALDTITSAADVCFNLVYSASASGGIRTNAKDGVLPDGKSGTTSNVILHTLLGANTTEDQAVVNNVVANGQRINWSTVSGTQYRTVAGLFGGTEVDAAVVSVDETTTAADATFSVTGLSFQPQAVIMCFGPNYSASNHFSGGFGVAVDNGAGTDQFAMEMASTGNADVASVADGVMLTDRCFVLIDASSEVRSWELTSWNSDGVTFTVRGSTGANFIAKCLFIKSTDWTFVAGQYTNPTSGTVTESGLGVDPEFMMDVMTLMQSTDTFINDSAQCSAYGIGLVSAAEQFSISANHQHNVSTSVAKSYVDSTGGSCLGDDGTIVIAGSVALGTDQWVKTLTTFPATATKGFYIVGGPATTGGGASKLAILKRIRHF